MILRPHCARPIVLASYALALAALAATFGCGSDANPSGPSNGNTPVIRTVTPSTGTSFGGTEVTISGEKFVAGSVVTFGGTAGTNVAVENANTIRVTTPSHASGPVDVAVSGSTGSGALPQAFTYVAPTGANTPPTIKSLTAKGRKANEPIGFADLSETIDVTAIVEDAETPIDKLTYQWSATAGAFTGTGPVVSWVAPGAAPTPVDVTITLTVVESYKGADASGLPIDRENRVTQTTTVTLHNSVQEVANMAEDFLVTFSNSSIGADTVLRDFAPTSICPGAAAERDDVLKNRSTRLITSYKVGTATVTINFGGACPFRAIGGDACASVPVEWHSKVLDHTTPIDYYQWTENTTGFDQVTGVYANKRWYLCASDYDMRTLTYTK